MTYTCVMWLSSIPILLNRRMHARRRGPTLENAGLHQVQVHRPRDRRLLQLVAPIPVAQLPLGVPVLAVEGKERRRPTTAAAAPLLAVAPAVDACIRVVSGNASVVIHARPFLTPLAPIQHTHVLLRTRRRSPSRPPPPAPPAPPPRAAARAVLSAPSPPPLLVVLPRMWAGAGLTARVSMPGACRAPAGCSLCDWDGVSHDTHSQG